MPLSSGDRLGPYEIIAPVGAGGMGEVYKARDTRVNRDVAIKTSRAGFSGRFQKEAEAIASLNHPNICTLFDVGPDYLVMEYIEGLTLAERIKHGPVPLDEALGIARQIAAALEAAHEKTIVHRDLKPANVKLRPDGSVKVLDFGLARIGEAVEDTDGNSPTLLSMPTMAGAIMGTAGYMSPEQTRGEKVDKRADIFAFGVVLYEMVTGKRLFDGKTISDSLAAVLTKEPNLAAAPIKVRLLLAGCLEKDPKTRLRDIGDWTRLLDERAPTEGVPLRSWRAMRGWIAAAGLAVVALTVSFRHFRETPATPQTVRFNIALPEGAALESFALSPNGRLLALAATTQGKRQLWLRPTDALQFQPIPFTEGAIGPFWSPDSRNIAFFAEGKLKKIPASGGPAQSLGDSGETFGRNSRGTWGPQDVILFSDSVGIHAIEARGGVPVDVMRGGRTPVLLPDGRHFLYRLNGSNPDQDGIYVSSRDGKENRQLLSDLSDAVFAPSPEGQRTGHVLFSRENTLMALPLDSVTAQPAGEVFPIAENVGVNINNLNLNVSVASTGALLYSSGTGLQNTRLTWFDREGKPTGTVGPAGIYGDMALSPDGAQVAADRTDFASSKPNRDLWLMDVAHGVPSRFTFDPAIEANPVWSPDGEWLAFLSRKGGFGLYRKRTNGTGGDERIVKSDHAQFAYDWSDDGKYLIYSVNDRKTRHDLWLLPDPASASDESKPRPFLTTPYNETQGQFSPKATGSQPWIAYTSDESGKSEIYAQPFAQTSAVMRGKYQLSSAGGVQPRWRHDGRELYYLAPDGRLMAVDVTTTPRFEHGLPRPLFQTRINTAGVLNLGFRYSPSPDGKRFLVNSSEGQAGPEPITVVLNWTAGLKK